MKMNAFVLIIFFWVAAACSDASIEVQRTDLAKHNMKIIPEKPGSKDEIKLVVFDDCTYNQLSGVNRIGHTIDLQKQFNSSMKLPCMQRNDTILIGKLPQGTYNVNYTLIDISQPAPQNISFSYTFQLEVTR